MIDHRTARTPEDEEFDRDAAAQSEVRCVNVSPFPSRFEVATVPGSKPRKYKLEPGQATFLQHGYTVPFLGASRKEVQPTVESLTEREAWAGVRGTDSDGKVIWKIKPGPKLPQVVSEERAAQFRALWNAAMQAQSEATTAPLRMTLQRTDGSSVEVEASVDPVPMRSRAKPAPLADDEDQAGPLDEPPPDHDDPEPVTLPAAAPLVPTHPTQTIPTRAPAPAAVEVKGDGKAKGR